MSDTQSSGIPEPKYTAEKPCCNICDRKKVCHVCGDQTLLACSDCHIDFKATIYVCKKSACRDEHEKKHPAALASERRRAEAAESEDDGKVKFSVTIPLEGAAKLRQVQELAGLKSLEDTIRFLLAIYAKRVKEGGYPFGEEGTR